MSEPRYDANVLAGRLDQALPAHKTLIPPVTRDPLVNTAAKIARLDVSVLSLSASSRIESRMLAAFDEQYRPRLVERPSWRSPALFRWTLVASLAVIVLLVGLTPAVAASLPGEPLYRLKQLYETVELSTATTSAAKANVYLQHADRRAQEAVSLLERNQFDSGLVTAALSNIAEAGKSENDVRASARLRSEVLQVDTLISFVLQNAQESGLTSPADVALLAQQVSQIENSDLLVPLPAILPSPTRTPTETLTVTPSPVPILNTGDMTPTCEHGQSCLSQGVPGGQIIPPTPKPTNVHRSTQPTPQSNPGRGAGSGGNSNGDSNGGGSSAGGNSNGNNGNGNGGNSGGHGNGG